jgi:hypothetical protein
MDVFKCMCVFVCEYTPTLPCQSTTNPLVSPYIHTSIHTQIDHGTMQCASTTNPLVYTVCSPYMHTYIHTQIDHGTVQCASTTNPSVHTISSPYIHPYIHTQIDHGTVQCASTTNPSVYAVCSADHVYRFPLTYKVLCSTGYKYKTYPGSSVTTQCTDKGDYTLYHTCENIDECAERTHGCDAVSQKCVDTDGSFDCLCK